MLLPPPVFVTVYSIPLIVRTFVSFEASSARYELAPTTFIVLLEPTLPVTVLVPSPPFIILPLPDFILNVSSPAPPFIK